MYEVILLTNMHSRQCPFPGCPVLSRSRSGLQNYFSRLHWGESILILEEHPTTFPHCERCKLQVPPCLLKNCHYNTEACRQGQELQRRQETLQQCFGENQVAIKVNLNPLEEKIAFPYLVVIPVVCAQYGQNWTLMPEDTSRTHHRRRGQKPL